MVDLRKVGERFEVPFQVIEGGSGRFTGILSETDQNAQPSYIFVPPRHVLRTSARSPVRAGMVIKSPSGAPFIVGENGPSETRHGTLWKSFRLFEPTGRYVWKRRTRVIDPITRIETEGPQVTLGLVWAAVEAMDRELSDREMRQNFEQHRVICAAPLQADDIFDNRTVSKLDRQLGLAIGMLT